MYPPTGLRKYRHILLVLALVCIPIGFFALLFATHSIAPLGANIEEVQAAKPTDKAQSRYTPRIHEDTTTIAGMAETHQRMQTEFRPTAEEERELVAAVTELAALYEDIDAALSITYQRESWFLQPWMDLHILNGVQAGKLPDSIRLDLVALQDSTTIERLGIGGTHIFTIQRQHIPTVTEHIAARSLSLHDIDLLINAQRVARGAIEHIEATHDALDRIIAALVEANLDAPLARLHQSVLAPKPKHFSSVDLPLAGRKLAYPLLPPKPFSFVPPAPSSEPP